MMKPVTALAFCLSMTMIAPSPAAIAQDEVFDIDRLVASPAISGPGVLRARLSPDGTRMTFLRGKEDNQTQQDLWEFHLPSGETRLLVDSNDLLGGAEEELDEVEKARRERQRITGSGIVEYQFSADGSALLFPLGGDLYYLPIGGEPRQLTRTEATETDAKISPQGNYVSYVREQNLYVHNLSTGQEQAITEAGGGPISYGMAEFVAQEEMDRDTGYWWAPDDSALAYTRVDEERVTLINRYEVGPEGGVTVIPQRYPFAGEQNAVVQLFVTELDGRTTQMRLGENDDIYLARVNWHPNSKHLYVQRQSRDQKQLDMIVFEPDGDHRVIMTETADSWLNLHHDLQFVEDGARFVWGSERDGFHHLYLYERDGRLVGQLTQGDWVVTGLAGVDEEAGRVYFTGLVDTPLEQHLYSVPLDPDPEDIIRATPDAGWHNPSVDVSAGLFIDNWSSDATPPQVVLRRLNGELVTEIEPNAMEEGHPYYPYLGGHAGQEFGTLEAEDGSTLFYSLRLPPDFDETREYPAILSVYGGPGAQRVRNAWSIDFDQILARNGYVVMKLDNRGSTNRGKAFEDHLYRHMGKVEVEDQAVGWRFLAEKPWIDENNIGTYGWSYGGYMTLMNLAKASDQYAAGVSVAPVSAWGLYDTHYTERFLGRPQDSDAYEKSDVFAYLEGLQSPLLLIHGMADDNVIYDHSVRVQSALQNQRTPFDLMTYAGKRHGIRGEDTRAHLWGQALRFFDRHLKD